MLMASESGLAEEITVVPPAWRFGKLIKMLKDWFNAIEELIKINDRFGFGSVAAARAATGSLQLRFLSCFAQLNRV